MRESVCEITWWRELLRIIYRKRERQADRQKMGERRDACGSRIIPVINLHTMHYRKRMCTKCVQNDE